jgi:hypothetical protein
MRDSARHLSIQMLQNHLASGVEVAYPFPGVPKVVLRIDGAVPQLTLRIASTDSAPTALNTMRNLRVSSVTSDGSPHLTVRVTGTPLMLDGHAMLCAIADRIQVEGWTPSEAIVETVTQWRTVLAARTRMSAEAELGLFGELMFLDALHEATGTTALEAWRGAAGEEHDFGLGHLDVEVKTTAGERRTHWISGVRQLLPTVGRQLALVSLQLTRGGASGRTLSELVDDLRTKLPDLAQFDDKLAQVGWHEADADLYVDRWVIRAEAIGFTVAGDFPCLTPPLLATLPIDSSSVVEVHYRIDLEGRPGDCASQALTNTLSIINSPEAVL